MPIWLISGISWGNVISFALSGLICQQLGWEWIFYIYGRNLRIDSSLCLLDARTFRMHSYIVPGMWASFCGRYIGNCIYGFLGVLCLWLTGSSSQNIRRRAGIHRSSSSWVWRYRSGMIPYDTRLDFPFYVTNCQSQESVAQQCCIVQRGPFTAVQWNAVAKDSLFPRNVFHIRRTVLCRLGIVYESDVNASVHGGCSQV